MNRLTSGTAALFALLLVGGCHSDPTGDLRNGIARIQAAPSTLNVTLGKTKTTQTSAVDEQGNPLSTAFEIKTVGSGISVKRDSTFAEEYVNDTLLAVPPEAPAFQFIVSGDALGPTNFTVTAEGKDVTIPVVVQPDAANLPAVAVLQTGPNASDQTILGLTAPYQFAPGATVAFDAGDAIVLGAAADGSTLTILPPPGATSVGTVTGVTVSYLPQLSLTDTTNVPLTIGSTVPAQPGTDKFATAPTITIPPSGGSTAFYDGAPLNAAVCGGLNTGAPCQLYKLVLSADAVIDATLGWSNVADMGLYILDSAGNDVPKTFCDANGRGAAAKPEACSLTLKAGTYFAAVVSFGPFYPIPGATGDAAGGPDPNPDWISLQFVTE